MNSVIDWTEIVQAVFYIVITGIIVPLVKYIKQKIQLEIESKTSAETKAFVTETIETAVRWAKQWLQSEAGEAKKSAVMDYVSRKLSSAGVSMTEEDLDKMIEATYEQIKSEVAE